MKIPRRIFSLVLVLILFACSQKNVMNIEDIPLPPEARQGTIEGSYEIGLDNATNAVLSELKKTYARTEEKILFLPAETDAARIFEFYEPKMSGKGFEKDGSVALQGRNYQQRVWKKAAQAVSVAVIEAGRDAAGKPIKFLAIHTGEK